MRDSHSGREAGLARYWDLLRSSLVRHAVEHPARLEAGMDVALRETRPSCRRASRLQASAAVIGTLASLGAWLLGSDSSWALSAAVLFLVLPHTLLIILPTNKKLLDPQLQPDEGARELLVQWGRWHSFRTLAGFLAFSMQVTASNSPHS